MIDSYLLSLIFWIWRSYRAILCGHRSLEKNYKTPALGKTLDNGLKVIYLCTANNLDIVDLSHQLKKSSVLCNLIAKGVQINRTSVLSQPSDSTPQANLTPAVWASPSVKTQKLAYRVKGLRRVVYGVVIAQTSREITMNLWGARIDTTVVHQWMATGAKNPQLWIKKRSASDNAIHTGLNREYR